MANNKTFSARLKIYVTLATQVDKVAASQILLKFPTLRNYD